MMDRMSLVACLLLVCKSITVGDKYLPQCVLCTVEPLYKGHSEYDTPL